MKILNLVVFLLLLNSCANIVMPTGGEKDTSSPTLLQTIPKNNSVNFQNDQITFVFNENIQDNKWNDYFNISPTTEKPLEYKISKNILTLFLDAELKDSTTFSINLNNCIKDINEGNILKNLSYNFSTSNTIDSLEINGKVIDAQSLQAISNAWVFLQNEKLADSLCVNTTPIYVTKTNTGGAYHFNNLNDETYKIFALDGVDIYYNNSDKIAFSTNAINAKIDSNKTLYLFDPLYQHKTIGDSLLTKEKKKEDSGKIILNCMTNDNLIIQLYDEKKLINEYFFKYGPYVLENIPSGKYNVKVIVDANKNNLWDTGNLNLQKLPEKIIKISDEINVRENWTLEVNCKINEL
ncbi:Ig-like domain-containing protein [Flavobacteriales bacterium]|nr:Ig-like domain-containing protein [Flavobacteriales bacterium]